MDYQKFEKLVKKANLKNFKGLPKFILPATDYLCEGKKLRSSFMFECAKIMECPIKKIIPSAALIEMIHSISILHDDVIDLQQERRNKKTINLLYSNSSALFLGDFLLQNKLKEIKKYDNHRLSSETIFLIKELLKGEISQYYSQNKKKSFPSLPKYLKNIKQKTGTLFAFSFKLPAIILKEKEEIICFYEECGYILGIIYQILDDIEDLQEDITQNKKIYFNHWTFPTIIWHQFNPKGLFNFLASQSKPNSLSDQHSIPINLISKEMFKQVVVYLQTIKYLTTVIKSKTVNLIFNFLVLKVSELTKIPVETYLKAL